MGGGVIGAGGGAPGVGNGGDSGVKNPSQSPIKVERECYTMATVDGDEAEIVMYGVIVEERPRNWWTGEEIEGNFIILEEFMEDLKKIDGVKKLTIRLNSVGGNAYAAIPIHNRLRELQREKKVEVQVIVDGVAMSGGSLIMCSAAHVTANPSSLIMIHKCWLSLWGGYNADDLRELASECDATDKAQVAIYRRKTGLSSDELLSMMAEATYMTGAEAMEKGFVDELLDSEAPAIAASADMRTLFVNGRAMHLPSPLSGLPDSIPKISAQAPKQEDVTVVDTAKADQTNTNQPADVGGKEGGILMAKNLEELRAENPELAEQLLAEAQTAVSETIRVEATEAERNRIKEIDEIASLYSDEIVQEAKYGEKACSAQEMTFRAAKEAAKKGKDVLEALNSDAEGSGAAKVQSVAPKTDESEASSPEQLIAQGRSDAKKLTKKEEK